MCHFLKSISFRVRVIVNLCLYICLLLIIQIQYHFLYSRSIDSIIMVSIFQISITIYQISSSSLPTIQHLLPWQCSMNVSFPVVVFQYRLCIVQWWFAPLLLLHCPKPSQSFLPACMANSFKAMLPSACSTAYTL